MAVSRNHHRKTPSKPRKKRVKPSKRFLSKEPPYYLIEDGAAYWYLPRKLKSLNRAKGRFSTSTDSKIWESLIQFATCLGDDGSLTSGHRDRMRVDVQRLVPFDHFALDKTNVAGAFKPVEDAFVRLGWLVDDNYEFEDGPYTSQPLSPNGKYGVIVKITKATESYVRPDLLWWPEPLMEKKAA